MCYWHQIDRRQNISLYHWLRLFSATDFDDIFVWSVQKLTLYEPNYKERKSTDPYVRQIPGSEVQWFFVLSSLARFVWVCMKYIHMRYWPSVRSRWLDMGQVLLMRFHGTKSIKTQKKNEVNIQPSWPNKLGQERTYIPRSIESFYFIFLFSSLLTAVRRENE